jgi:CTD small phosphatase-like protein 2
VNIRPYAVDFIREMSKLYEVVVFTASHACYANVVLDYIDPMKQYISHRLFREKCLQSDSGVYIKDLRILAERNMNEVVLVDNASYSFGFQIDNGIPIIPFYNSKEDTELLSLWGYLEQLERETDVRTMNRRHFKLRNIVDSKDVDDAFSKVIPKS